MKIKRIPTLQILLETLILPRKNLMWYLDVRKKLRIPFSLKTNNHLTTLALVGLVVPGIPMMFFKNDMWDGVIIDFNLRENNLEPLRSWFFMSGWELQYYLVRIQDLASDALNVSTRGLILSISLFALISLSNEVYLLAKNTFRLTNRSAMYCSILLLLQPTWNVLVSSIMNMHIVCLSLGILGSRLFLGTMMYKKITGALLIVIGFQLNSMLLFIPTLILVIKLIEGVYYKQRKIQIRDFIIVSCMAVVYLFSQRVFNPNEGPYLFYNNFVIPNSVDVLQLYLINILNFSTFLLFPLLAIVTTVSRNISNSVYSSGKEEYLRIRVLSLLMLFASAAAPYILVGKSTNIFDLTDWSQRQSFVVTVPVVILTGLLLSEKIQEGSSIKLRRAQVITSSVILVLTLSLLLNSFAIKHNRQIFENKLITALQEVVLLPRSGLFQINGPGIPGPILRTYESNFLLYRAYSDASWWSLVQETRDMSFSYPTNQEIYNTEGNVFQPSVDMCSSLVEIISTGFERPVLNILQTYFGRDSSSVRVLEFETYCGPLQVFSFKENRKVASEVN
jgi:hypothetical protein